MTFYKKWILFFELLDTFPSGWFYFPYPKLVIGNLTKSVIFMFSSVLTLGLQGHFHLQNSRRRGHPYLSIFYHVISLKERLWIQNCVNICLCYLCFFKKIEISAIFDLRSITWGVVSDLTSIFFNEPPYRQKWKNCSKS